MAFEHEPDWYAMGVDDAQRCDDGAVENVDGARMYSRGKQIVFVLFLGTLILMVFIEMKALYKTEGSCQFSVHIGLC